MDRKPLSKYAVTKGNYMTRVFQALETGSNQFI